LAHLVAAAGFLRRTARRCFVPGFQPIDCSAVVQETTMLSPHEFATLLLVKDSPTQVDMNRDELDALLERQLVELERLVSGQQRLRVTATGDHALKAIKRLS
jgi:hypothetical protein